MTWESFYDQTLQQTLSTEYPNAYIAIPYHQVPGIYTERELLIRCSSSTARDNWSLACNLDIREPDPGIGTPLHVERHQIFLDKAQRITPQSRFYDIGIHIPDWHKDLRIELFRANKPPLPPGINAIAFDWRDCTPTRWQSFNSAIAYDGQFQISQDSVALSRNSFGQGDWVANPEIKSMATLHRWESSKSANFCLTNRFVYSVSQRIFSDDGILGQAGGTRNFENADYFENGENKSPLRETMRNYEFHAAVFAAAGVGNFRDVGQGSGGTDAASAVKEIIISEARWTLQQCADISAYLMSKWLS